MKSKMNIPAFVILGFLIGSLASSTHADSQAGMLAKQLANPLASMISVPLQYNYDAGYGPADASRAVLNIQPVIPFNAGHFRVLSRTIVPLVNAEGLGTDGSDLSGVGDMTQSFFVTPARPMKGGWLVGIGPVAQFPIGSDHLLTTDKWSLGPTAIVVRQGKNWTYGALTNHMWSIAGNGERSRVSTTYMQPFINYIAPTHTTLAINLEASRDWNSDTWSVPLNAMINQLLKVGSQPISVFVGVRYWCSSTEVGPDGWGIRSGITLLFPTKRPPTPQRSR